MLQARGSPSCIASWFEDFVVFNRAQVVPKEMLRMFNPEEMQVLSPFSLRWLLE
jgi:hypothetical protein